MNSLINTKPVYLFDIEGNFLKKFETTNECGEYFGKDREYINHNLKYCKKIRKDCKWYVIRRKNESNRFIK
jgi:hypothetical protein